MDEIELGDRVRDRVTEVEGIVVAKTLWLAGCDRIGIQPPGMHDGKPIELWWVDITLCDMVEKGVVEVPEAPFGKTGGPRPDPSR